MYILIRQLSIMQISSYVSSPEFWHVFFLNVILILEFDSLVYLDVKLRRTYSSDIDYAREQTKEWRYLSIDLHEIFLYIKLDGDHRGVVSYVLGYDIILGKFERQWCYYVSLGLVHLGKV